MAIFARGERRRGGTGWGNSGEALTKGWDGAAWGMIKLGETIATKTKLVAVRAGVEAKVAVSELLTRPTVFSIYMRNNTGSCDKQNDSLVAAAGAIEAAGFNLVAVSRDSAAAHVKYAQKKRIVYTLVSDPKYVFAKAADAVVTKAMYGKTYEGPARAAFVIGVDGKVLAVIPKVEAKSHGEQVLAVLGELK